MLCDEVRRLRKAHGYSQVTFADSMGVSQSTVASWENGTRRPDLDLLCRMAEIFNVSLDVLLGRMTPKSESILLPSESELITIFRDLNDKGQDALLRQARYLASDPDMKKGFRVEYRDGIAHLIPR